MIYVDANAFIYALAYNDNHPDAIKSKIFLADVRSNKTKACTTILTWDEVFYHLKKHLGETVAIEKGRMLISYPNLTFIDMTQKTIKDAQEICENFHLDPRDAIHSACALNHCSGDIFSRDDDYDSVLGINRIFKQYQKAS